VSLSFSPTSPSQSLKLMVKIPSFSSVTKKLSKEISGTLTSHAFSLHELRVRNPSKIAVKCRLFINFEKIVFPIKNSNQILNLDLFNHKIQSSDQFLATAIKVFQFQYKNCEVYQSYVNALGINYHSVNSLERIPFLPISFFKTHEVKSFLEPAAEIFLSSATTGMVQSKHYVKSLALYEKSFFTGFESFYGDVSQYVVIGLLPSYLDRSGSSLVYMVNQFIEKSKFPESGFYKKINAQLINTLRAVKESNKKALLIGVAYALMDLADTIDFSLEGFIVLETGGMKGNRKEILKEELHEYLSKGLQVSQVHSEYGMTELLSQAYSLKNEEFISPSWMKVLTREVNDPFAYLKGKTGAINIIDLANVFSCSFIATDDLGVCLGNGNFKVMGRMTGSDTRGCNLLYETSF